MSTQSVIVLAKVDRLTRRVSPKGKPYWLALCDITSEEQVMRVPVVIGASPAQIAKGVTTNELSAFGFTETVDAAGKTVSVLENAIIAPEQAEGAEVSLRWEDPSDANPSGSYRVVTAQNAPEADFRAALAAQTAKPAAPRPVAPAVRR